MQRTFRWSIFVFLVLVLSIAIPNRYPENGAIQAIGYVLGLISLPMALFVGIVVIITGIGILLERDLHTLDKRKKELRSDFDSYPARLQKILHKLSPKDRAYLHEQLTARELGVANDGEIVPLDEVMARKDSQDENSHSQFTG